MLSLLQLIRALRKLQRGTNNNGDLTKTLKYAAAVAAADNVGLPPTVVTSLMSITKEQLPQQQQTALMISTAAATTHDGCQTSHITPTSGVDAPVGAPSASSSITPIIAAATSEKKLAMAPLHASGKSSGAIVSPILDVNENGCATSKTFNTETIPVTQETYTFSATIAKATAAPTQSRLGHSQQIQNFRQQQLHHFHTQNNQNLNTKPNQTKFSMSSLAAEPLVHKSEEMVIPASPSDGSDCHMPDANGAIESNSAASCASGKKPCFTTGLAEILQFMELIGNLKHTKRTGWVLREVNDCESISGHMYRMSMMTFLLDGSEGLNQIRCMELALVHDLAESLVGDITPFCGVSKEQKRTMEFKAMEDICKLIEPRGKRIMELFEEYEHGKSAESRFVKDLDRLDMIMQAFEYEKRDDCLLKHQEFFDSTEGKFNHPFVKKLVNEIYEQRKQLAQARGATPPPTVHVPNMDEPSTSAAAAASSSVLAAAITTAEPIANGHYSATTAVVKQEQEQQQQQQQAQKTTSSSTS